MLFDRTTLFAHTQKQNASNHKARCPYSFFSPPSGPFFFQKQNSEDVSDSAGHSDPISRLSHTSASTIEIFNCPLSHARASALSSQEQFENGPAIIPLPRFPSKQNSDDTLPRPGMIIWHVCVDLVIAQQHSKVTPSKNPYHFRHDCRFADPLSGSQFVPSPYPTRFPLRDLTSSPLTYKSWGGALATKVRSFRTGEEERSKSL